MPIPDDGKNKPSRSLRGIRKAGEARLPGRQYQSGASLPSEEGTEGEQ